MASTVSTEPTLIENAGGGVSVLSSSTSARNDVPVTRLLPTASRPNDTDAARTTYHIYIEKEQHKRIQSRIDLKHESPRSAARRADKKAKKKAKKGVVVEAKAEAEPDLQAESEYKNCGGAFFLHAPYLAFHDPPLVLYAGEDKNATPAVLIHGNAFWRRYKLQYGYQFATGVLDPRGVVAWKHNGGNKEELKADDKKLKGYKVRTWRLWGESGKAYVNGVNANRKAGIRPDPDDPVDSAAAEEECPAQAEGVVYLKWEHPFSRHTRQYHFHYNNIDFYWKGTKTVKKPNISGMFVRYSHLKLIAKIPATDEAELAFKSEVCLGTYTCSVSSKKCGRLELFDSVILQLAEQYVEPVGTMGLEEDERLRVLGLKKTWFYRIIVATAMCMINSEKEKRQAVGEWLENAGDGGE